MRHILAIFFPWMMLVGKATISASLRKISFSNKFGTGTFKMFYEGKEKGLYKFQNQVLSTVDMR